MLHKLKIHLHIYILIIKTQQLYFWYTKYLKSVKLELPILYLMHFIYLKVVLKVTLIISYTYY